MTNTFSYIIPAYNSEKTLRDTLDSVLGTESVTEIILVDDQSEDGTKDIAGYYQKENKKIKYLRNPRRLGAGLSRNKGAQAARGGVLVFLDADITIPADTGKIVEKYFREEKINPAPDAIVAGRKKETPAKGMISMYKNYWTSFNFSKLGGWTSFLCSSFFALKKDVFFDVGGFREIPHTEDNDLGYRLALNDYKIYFTNDISVSHKKTFTLLNLLKREFIAGREGIKTKIKNKAFGDILKKKKFFAVNKNFVYSFPFALICSLSALAGIVFMNVTFLYFSVICIVILALLNGEFLSYASCKKNYIKAVFFLLLMIAQLNAIAIGMLFGIFKLLRRRISKYALFVLNYSRSFIKVFAKNALPPEQVTFFVTDRCNLNCAHCFVNRNHTNPENELTPLEFEKISRAMGRVNYVTITGGEPFLRADIADIAEVLSRNLKPSLITVLTNGYMSDLVVDKASNMLEKCPDQDILIKTSIDGPPEIHDNMRQKPGAFNEARNTFKRLKNLKKLYKNLSLGIITTYTSRNKGHIQNLYKDIITDLAPDQYGLTLERPRKANELNEEINIADYTKALKDINVKMAGQTRGFFRKFRLAYKIKLAGKVKEIYDTKRYPLKCFAGMLNAVISAEGDVFPCEQLSSKFGSLREANCNWAKIWHSPRAQNTRDFIRKKGCFCANECYLPFNMSYDIKEFLGVSEVFFRNIVFPRGIV